MAGFGGGFGGGFPGGNMQQMLKQAQAMQEKMKREEEEINNAEFEASSGGGMVKVVMLGNHKLKKIEINPGVIDPDDKETLEDLIMAAINEAEGRIEEKRKSRFGQFGGLI